MLSTLSSIFFTPVSDSLLFLHFPFLFFLSFCFHLLILFNVRRRGFSSRGVTRCVDEGKYGDELAVEHRLKSRWETSVCSPAPHDCSVLVWTWTPQQKGDTAEKMPLVMSNFTADRDCLRNPPHFPPVRKDPYSFSFYWSTWINMFRI